jgi:hypothetical protein
MIRTHRLAALCAAALLAAASGSAEKLRNHFDSDAPFRVPGFFDLVLVTGSAPADWKVMVDTNPPSTANRLTQVTAQRPDGSVAAALRRNVQLRDGSVSVYVKRSPSQGGILFRMADSKTFVLMLVSPISGDVVLRSYRDAKATELGRAKFSPSRDWEQFEIRAAGPSLTVFHRDTKLFEATDPAPVSGRVGVATEGAGEASFDELVIDGAEAGSR